MRILINNQTKESTYYDPRKAVKKRYYYDDDEEEDIETPAPQPIQQENPAPNGRPRTERDNRFYEKLQVNDSDDEKTKRIKEKALRNLQKIPKRNLASSIILLVFILIFAVSGTVLIEFNILTSLSIGLIAGVVLVIGIGELSMFFLDFRLPSDLRRIPTKIISMIGAVTGLIYALLFLLVALRVIPSLILFDF